MSPSSSSPTAAASATTTTATAATFLANIGLGYSIAIALGFLLLVSTLILSSYLCCRSTPRPDSNHNPNTLTQNPDGIVLPRIIFVAEDERDENGVVVGLRQNVINSYPRFQYTKVGDDGGAGNSATCSICLCEYREAEMLRMMPECRHYFHMSCLDAWLKRNGSCPVCRNSPLPTPLSTPLQEVVPLSQYSDDRRRRS